MNIPSVPDDRIIFKSSASDIPLMPFLPLLLLKVQAWEDHGNSPRLYFRQKQPTDVCDINQLLNLALSDQPKFRVRLEKEWLPEDFLKEGNRRVRAYIKAYPTTRRHWKFLGFDLL